MIPIVLFNYQFLKSSSFFSFLCHYHTIKNFGGKNFGEKAATKDCKELAKNFGKC